MIVIVNKHKSIEIMRGEVQDEEGTYRMSFWSYH